MLYTDLLTIYPWYIKFTRNNVGGEVNPVYTEYLYTFNINYTSTVCRGNVYVEKSAQKGGGWK